MYPKMIIIRNRPNGLIWQAYTVQNEQEERILTANAKANYFGSITSEPVGYTEETTPGWRDTPEWKDCLTRDKKQG